MSEQMSEAKIVIAGFFWTAPDKPPYPPPMETDDNRPFLVKPLLSVPQPGEIISFELPHPKQAEPIIYEMPAVVVHGKVVSVTPVKSKKLKEEAYTVRLERTARTGLVWDELGACIGAEMVGFHPDIGRVEGKLIGLLPEAELALVRVPALLEHYTEAVREAGHEVDEDDINGDDLSGGSERGPVVFLAWSSLWTAEGLRLMRSRDGEQGSAKSSRSRAARD